MSGDIGFGDLIRVRNRGWEIAVRDKGAIISIITPPPPTMDGSGVISYWGVKRSDIEDHIRAAAVPGAIEALERIENGVTTTDSYGTQMALSDWDMEDIARAALRAVRGEEAK